MAKEFTDPIGFLTEAKEALQQLEAARAKQEELQLSEKRQSKLLASEKKAVEDAVNSTIKKRKDELASSYDTEIAKLQDSMKKTRAKREKAKQQGIKERIEAQLAPFKEENKEMNGKIKTMLKQDHAPAFCNSTLFYALYFPRSVKEVLTMIFTFLVCCAGIPCGIFWLLPERKPLWLVLIYLGVIIIFGGLYIMVGNVTKDAHRQVLLEAGQVRRAIAKNRKKMNSITRSIRREKSEEHYDLSAFDRELADKEKEKTELAAKKEEAMAYFIRTTKPAITEEIVSGSRERISQLEAAYGQTEKELAENADVIKNASLTLSNDYESYIGKEFMQADKLEALIRILQDGKAANITEAEAFYRELSSAKR